MGFLLSVYSRLGLQTIFGLSILDMPLLVIATLYRLAIIDLYFVM